MSIVNIFQAKRGGTQGRDGNGFIYYLNRKTAQKIDELTPLVYLETMAKFMDYD